MDRALDDFLDIMNCNANTKANENIKMEPVA